MEFNFKYRLTEDEFADYNIFTGWSAPWQKKVRIRNFFILFLSTVFGVFIAESVLSGGGNVRRSLESRIIIGLSITLIVAFLFWLQTPNTLRRKTKKMARHEDNRHFFTESELSVTEDGILCIDENSTTRYSWASIIRFAVTK
jgi:hypothetical protein